MNTENSDDQRVCASLAAYLVLAADNELSAAEWRVVEQHLALCPPCRAQWAAFARTDRRLLECAAELNALRPSDSMRARLVNALNQRKRGRWTSWLPGRGKRGWAVASLASLSLAALVAWTSRFCTIGNSFWRAAEYGVPAGMAPFGIVASMSYVRGVMEMPVYSVTQAKSGPLLQKAAIEERDCPGPEAPASASASCHKLAGGRGRGIRGSATGIEGLFNIQTTGWRELNPGDPSDPNANVTAATSPTDLPTLCEVFEKLGLRLKPQKGRSAMIVVDAVQKPSEN